MLRKAGFEIVRRPGDGACFYWSNGTRLWPFRSRRLCCRWRHFAVDGTSAKDLEYMQWLDAQKIAVVARLKNVALHFAKLRNEPRYWEVEPGESACRPSCPVLTLSHSLKSVCVSRALLASAARSRAKLMPRLTLRRPSWMPRLMISGVYADCAVVCAQASIDGVDVAVLIRGAIRTETSASSSQATRFSTRVGSMLPRGLACAPLAQAHKLCHPDGLL